MRANCRKADYTRARIWNMNNYSVFNLPKAAMPYVIDCYILLFTTKKRRLAIASCAKKRISFSVMMTFCFWVVFSTCFIVLCVGLSSLQDKNKKQKIAIHASIIVIRENVFFFNVLAFVCLIELTEGSFYQTSRIQMHRFSLSIQQQHNDRPI